MHTVGNVGYEIVGWGLESRIGDELDNLMIEKGVDKDRYLFIGRHG